MAVVDEPVVRVGLREIYDTVVAVEKKVDLLLEHNLPRRVTALERYAWGIPASIIVALIGVGTAVSR